MGSNEVLGGREGHCSIPGSACTGLGDAPAEPGRAASWHRAAVLSQRRDRSAAQAPTGQKKGELVLGRLQGGFQLGQLTEFGLEGGFLAFCRDTA